MDNCPVCGKRILDWDPEGCELPSGQRVCLVHLTPAQRQELDHAYDLEDREMGERLGTIDIEEAIDALDPDVFGSSRIVNGARVFDDDLDDYDFRDYAKSERQLGA